MGKPFSTELDKLNQILEWVKKLDIKALSEIFDNYNDPVYIVGSGGSLSACYFAANLFASKGIFAKAITPFELLYSRAVLKKSNIIFISASGKNTDILLALKTAIKEEPLSITAICMKTKTKLSSIASNYSVCTSVEFNNPAGKDGFLATNSLLAYYAILYKAILRTNISLISESIQDDFYNFFFNKIKKGAVLNIIWGSFFQSIAIDLESKFTEAGLGSTLITDFRNFAHGRHNWFDKQKNSAIIALASPLDDALCTRTLDLLPGEIPKLVLFSKIVSFEASIDLLIKSFYLVRAAGWKVNIDPGMPGVPEYGSKLYNLKYERLLKRNVQASTLVENTKIAIMRKSKVNNIGDLNNQDLKFWESAHKSFLDNLMSAKFGCIIFDYDGTLCTTKNRFTGLTKEIEDFLIQFLKKGFVVGIATGRGKSIRTDLDKIFTNATSHLKKNVLIGYYNGSDVSPLTDNRHPDKNAPLHPSLLIIKNHLKDFSIKPDESPHQLTFGADGKMKWQSIRDLLLNEIMLLNLSDIKMVESSHSIDIVSRIEGSKNNIIPYCLERGQELKLSQGFICIGDKGQWPGNDYELLNNTYSLSVGDVSLHPETCWNICPAGVKNIEGTKYLFNKIKFENQYFTFTDL